MAEDISIHDPNTQEVKPTSVTFERLFITEHGGVVVRYILAIKVSLESLKIFGRLNS